MELNICLVPSSYYERGLKCRTETRTSVCNSKSTILEARQLARHADEMTRQRLEELAAELELKLREIDQ